MNTYKSTKTCRTSFLLLLLLTSVVLAACGRKDSSSSSVPDTEKTAQGCLFKTQGKYFSILTDNGYEPVYIKGVNLGSGKPGSYPGELAITKDEYLRWFQEISDMNCNTIRVYTVMMPQFYQALYEYNASAANKLYLFQGVWYNEEQISETEDAYDIYDEALNDACSLVDIFHGNASLPKKAGVAYGDYKYDISEYVIGWILGIESDAKFVGNTDAVHADETDYEGTYLHTSTDASPYEAFMCRLADETISYEMNQYNMQRPVSWSNWPTADMLIHENDPDREKEDAITINVEHIQATDAFEAGVFASYHIYSYYPEFIIYENKDYVDASGNVNPYRAYLEQLIAQHTMPVLVAEYGIPTSRGITHNNPITGYNQGHVDETSQGEMLVSMSKDIYETGYCGSLIFTWQDEWFKRTWNTMDYTDSDRRAYWSDMQTSEQNFGLLTFDPGKKETCVALDGDNSEWTSSDFVAQNDNYTLSVRHDARYLYLMVQGDNLNPQNDRIIIPVDVTPKSGALQYESCTFSRGTDFVIDLQEKNNSVIKVQGYYDRYPVSYTAEMDTTFNHSDYGGASDSDFHPVYLCLNKQLLFPVTKEWIDYQRFETGLLQYGNGDPESDDYNSLSDFCYGEHCIELRIPWGLLNFRDPSSREVEDDFHTTDEFTGLNIDEIYLGIGSYGQSQTMNPYTWDTWDSCSYHERLKKSYYIIQDYFKDLNLKN